MAEAERGSGILVAKQTGFVVHDGERYAIRAGVTRIRDTHPLMQKHADFFEPIEGGLMPDVEQATAAPGEKRETPKPPKVVEEEPKTEPDTEESEPLTVSEPESKKKGGPITARAVPSRRKRGSS